MRRKKKVSQKNVLHVSIEQKARAKKLNYRMAAVAGGLVVVVLLLVGLRLATDQVWKRAFYENDVFTIRRIHVDVKGTLDTKSVLRFAGVKKGDNLIAIDLSEIRERIINMPYVAEARVERVLPSTLKIEVRERQPVARVFPMRTSHRQAQSIYYVDREGFVMKPRPGERLKPLPLITGVDAEIMKDGARTEHELLLASLSLLNLADISKVRSTLDLTQIEVNRKGFLVLKTRGGGLIRFREDYLQQQMDRLETIIAFARNRRKQVKTVDLTPERNVPITFYNQYN